MKRGMVFASAVLSLLYSNHVWAGDTVTMVDESLAFKVYHHAKSRDGANGGYDYWYELKQLVFTNKKTIIGTLIIDEKTVQVGDPLATPTTQFSGVGLGGLENRTAYILVKDVRKDTNGFDVVSMRVLTLEAGDSGSLKLSTLK